MEQLGFVHLKFSLMTLPLFPEFWSYNWVIVRPNQDPEDAHFLHTLFNSQIIFTFNVKFITAVIFANAASQSGGSSNETMVFY